MNKLVYAKLSRFYDKKQRGEKSNWGKENSFQSVVSYKNDICTIFLFFFYQFTCLCALLMNCKYTKKCLFITFRLRIYRFYLCLHFHEKAAKIRRMLDGYVIWSFVTLWYGFSMRKSQYGHSTDGGPGDVFLGHIIHSDDPLLKWFSIHYRALTSSQELYKMCYVA